jgi:HK97 gp10 family phage protein
MKNFKFQQAIKDVRSKREAVANEISMLMERESKMRAPVGETGHLRRSTGSEVEHKENQSDIEVGTNNVEYAKIVHDGSVVRNITAQPYIRDAIEQNQSNMEQIIAKGMTPK